MWRNVKALEEENKRLRKEREEWVSKALELSKPALADISILNAKGFKGSLHKLVQDFASQPIAIKEYAFFSVMSHMTAKYVKDTKVQPSSLTFGHVTRKTTFVRYPCWIASAI